MARQSKRHREASRFGTSNLLVDKISEVVKGPPPRRISGPEYIGDPQYQREKWREYADYLLKNILTVPIIEVSNIYNFVKERDKKNDSMQIADIAGCISPFAACFLEYSTPGEVPDRAGWLAMNSPLEFVRTPIPEESKYCITMHFVAMVERQIYVSGFMVDVPLDKDGNPFCAYASFALNISDCLPEEEVQKYQDLYTPHIGVPLNAFSFMNCKNVSTRVEDPHHEINRERRRHNRLPFAKYHVIQIEPNTRTTRTTPEEPTGIKRSLHICRGHFAEYTEEKPLFGRVAGRFWIPQHERGSIEIGTVTSDYLIGDKKT
jgi:hypothetical protein